MLKIVLANKNYRRFRTYGVTVGDTATTYMGTIEALPSYRAWAEASRAEPWHISEYDAA